MTKILVKNGDWDKARSELGVVLDAKKASFNAQFEAAFASNRKPAARPEPAPPKQSKAEEILSKNSSVSALPRSRPRG
ncbi:MAG: hypothetical protein Q8M24_21380 [Pseudolabrys sp.]|nr:hypothetical protein [Pseudolabrys sp.]MDP2298001.1 hypothetical protein [Pseudolabrys sp.]